MKKVLAILLAAIMLLPVMSFASADEPALSGTLTIWAWGADAEAEQREAIIQAFIKAHPELKVEYSIIPTADSVWDQKAAAALTSGSAPDVMQMSPDYFGMNTKYYMDLRPFVERDGINLDEVLVPGMIDGYYDTDGKLEGLAEQVEALQKSDAYLFDTNTGTQRGGIVGNPDVGNATSANDAVNQAIRALSGRS